MSDQGGGWAPFGPGGDDEPPRRTPPPEPEPESEPPPSEPPPPAPIPIREPEPEPEPEPELPPAAAFEPPVAPAPSPLSWPEPAPPAPPAPPISTWPGAPPAGYATPKKIPSNATASLVLGIVGLVMCPLIASIPAVALGMSAKREIRENPGLGGDGQATWGIALGWVGIVLTVLVLVLVLLGAVVTTSNS